MSWASAVASMLRRHSSNEVSLDRVGYMDTSRLIDLLNFSSGVSTTLVPIVVLFVVVLVVANILWIIGSFNGTLNHNTPIGLRRYDKKSSLEIASQSSTDSGDPSSVVVRYNKKRVKLWSVLLWYTINRMSVRTLAASELSSYKRSSMISSVKVLNSSGESRKCWRSAISSWLPTTC